MNRNDVRDLVREAIWQKTKGTKYRLDATKEAADAVLAALDEAGALMPDLPDNWWSIELYKSLDGTISRYNDEPPIPAGHVYADMWDDADGPILSGTGPTPTAAIRAALEAKP